MFVNASVPAKSVQEFIDLAKSRPGQIDFGAGTAATHLAGEKFRLATGTDIKAIPYKGTGPRLLALLSGEVSMAVDGFPALSHVKSGTLRALAALCPKRSPVLPDVPAMRESGVHGVEIGSWTGLMAPNRWVTRPNNSPPSSRRKMWRGPRSRSQKQPTSRLISDVRIRKAKHVDRVIFEKGTRWILS